jgi:hypothetical protein
MRRRHERLGACHLLGMISSDQANEDVVSTARMALLEVSPDPVPHVRDGARFGRFGKQALMDVGGGIAARSPHDHPIAVIVPSSTEPGPIPSFCRTFAGTEI